MCKSMVQVPTVVAEARRALEEGHCVVIGLQSTGEAAADALGLEPGQARCTSIFEDCEFRVLGFRVVPGCYSSARPARCEAPEAPPPLQGH